MKHVHLFLFACVAGISASADDFTARPVTYELDGTTFQSTVTWDQDESDKRPGILMIPNWMGPTKASLKKAQEVADMGFVVMMVDMYGVDVRPENGSEAGAAAGKVRGDRSLMRARAAKALEVFRAMDDIPLRKGNIAAIGFCFGGGTVLELGRDGADLDALVSFHGDLVSPTLEADAGKTRAKVLVLHGADDPYVPQTDVAAFVKAMQATDVDWQLVQFSGTVHSFTDPNARSPGKAEYNERSSDRAFEYMEELLDEIWDD